MASSPHHHLVVLRDVLQHVRHFLLASAHVGNLARDERFRLLEPQRELPFDLPDPGEVLVEPRAVRRAEPAFQRLALLGDHRQHALARHGRRIGRERGGIRIHEPFAEEALVEARHVRLDRVHLPRALAAQRVAAVADPGHVERAEPRVVADVVGDDAVERLRGQRAADARRDAAPNRRPAGGVREVGPAVGQAVEAAEDRDLVLVRRHRLRLRQDFPVGSRRRRMKAAGRHAQTPEPRAEPHRQRRARGQRRPVAVQEAVEIRQRYGDRRALEHAAQHRAPADA